MDSEIVDAVTEWDASPFSGGYEGLQQLADSEFSGAITEGTAWGFMLNGRLLRIEDGSIAMFETADGTAYESPTPALPLLYAMQGHGEKQAQYYTNNKSISEADSTLSSGSFTGYIELSENVLSGDYYTVYYGGKSMSVAFVGNSRKLLTDEEAFQRADDEVGIYTVYAADLEVITIPQVNSAGGDTSAESTKSAESAESAESTETEPTESAESTGSTGSTQEVDDDASHDGLSVETDSADSLSTEPTKADRNGSPTDSTVATSSTDSPPAAGSESANATESSGSQSATESASPSEAASRQSTNAGRDTETETPSKTQRASTDTKTTTQTTRTTGQQASGVFNEEAEWQKAKTIPSLDPSGETDTGETTQTTQATQSSSSRKQGSNSKRLSRTQLRQRLKRAEQILQKAETQHEALVAERDEAQSELKSVRKQLSEAEAEIERLETQLASTSTDTSSGSSTSTSTAGQSISETEALEGTNLLIRYASKGDGTLEDAASGAASKEDVRANIRIESHTTFNSEDVSVDGVPFETFLEGRIELAFVRWFTQEFLFDIQQTGNQNDLSGIYETIPAINRAELRGSVSLGTDEEGDSLDATFDLVVRDKRDRPLFVAEFNESKQPVGNGMVNSLVRDGSEIVQQYDSFAAAFAVTTSYYEGSALDAAADATGGGLLSASRGKSFVYISRKQGFHLCLVEQLGDTFDLHVPEL